MKEFVHLHNHTHYSILDAVVNVKELVGAAVQDKQKAIALTDHGVMFGTIEFYEECKKNNIKPIIGCEVYIANGSRFDKDSGKEKTKKKNYYHLLLLAKNDAGYKNLMQLSTIGHTEGFYYRPRIDKEVLAKYSEGLVCTSACMGGIINANLKNGLYAEAKKEAEFYKSIFGNDFYMEIQNHGIEGDDIILRDAPKLAKELGIKLVATNDIHYLKKEDAVAHNILLNIRDAKGKTEVDINALRYGTDEFYFKTQAEMIELFKDFSEAIETTLEIADKCNLELELGKLYMPEFPISSTSNATTLDEYLQELVFEGLSKRYNPVADEIKQRAEYELNVIRQMKFPGYFLIVWDFIRAAKELGVSVGPGRGSAAGSIVAYALNITNVDPLKYDLLFERFLNPERVSMPDIDIDFSDETRDRIIDYVKNKYGERSVAQIITFGTLSSRAVITDVGRVLGIELDTVRKITKQIDVFQGRVEKVSEAIEKPALAWVKNSDNEKLRILIQNAKILENRNRGTGTHAAGVIIAPGDVSDYVPLYKPEKKTTAQSLDIVTQYEMSYLEKAALVKMDFLGLTTLSIIDRTLEMIKANYNIDIDLDKIDFDDAKTFKMVGNGQTKAIFQFESKGMQEYLKQLKPQNLEELTAMNALYRPGPMGNIPAFISRKHGKEPITYLHPIMEKPLKNTYGIIVYQEQVMQLARNLAGFSLGKADDMRRAMGKKDKEKMDKLKPPFVEGCISNDISKDTAEKIFDLLEKFASYGFNKSHSLAYSYLAFQTAWLKAHYTAEFLASNMTASINSLDNLVELIAEAGKMGIEVLSPDVNQSITNFVVKNNKIFFGLAGIKGVGIPAVENIVETRKEGNFTSIFDFTTRIDTRIVTKRTLEALVASGAFDSIYGKDKRSILFNSVDLAIEYAKNMSAKNDEMMDDMFGSVAETSSAVSEPKLIFTPAWTDLERINKEKEYLNFYISGHPLDDYFPVISSLNSVSLAKSDEEATNVIKSIYGFVSGLVTDIRMREDREKNKIAFVKIENYTGNAELIFWSDAYKACQNILSQNAIICCQGKIDTDSEEMPKVVVDEAHSIEKAVQKYSTGYCININLDNFDNEKLYRLKHEVKDSVSSKLHFRVYSDEKMYQQAYSANNIGMAINMDNIKKLSGIFGNKNISLSTIVPSAPAPKSRWAK